MNKIKHLFAGIGVFAIVLCAAERGAAQAPAPVEPSYEISLHLLMGSNEANAKGTLPAHLSGLTQQLRSRVAYTNFRLAGTIIGRVSNQGSLEYKSFSDLFGTGNDPKFRSFLDFGLGQFRSAKNERGTTLFSIQNVRFGARVPVVQGYRRDETGKDQPIVNYEQIGLTLQKLGLSENAPTLIGTLDLPNGSEMIFLMMTIKPLEG